VKVVERSMTVFSRYRTDTNETRNICCSMCESSSRYKIVPDTDLAKVGGTFGSNNSLSA